MKIQHDASPSILRRGLLLALPGLLVTSLGCAAYAAEPPRPKPAPTPESGEYRIGPEDVLHVSVWKNDAVSRTVTVRPDGKISLPLLNDVPAAGLTPMQLREALARRLSEYIPNPEVYVMVEEMRSAKVSVMGEVVRPGRYEIRSRTTVLDILAQAGGFTAFADPSRIVILRPNGGETQRIRFKYNRVLSPGEGEENLSLLPGDIVVVP